MAYTEAKKRGRTSYFLIGAALGTALAYIFDPDEGRRRRALLRDKSIRVRNDAGWYGRRYARHLNNFSYGLVYRVSKLFQPEPIPDNDVLVQRVRSEMGRVVRHPRAIEVIADHGRVTLRGPILANDVRRLFNCVRSVPGVRHVVNEMRVHQTGENVPGLQGEGKPYVRDDRQSVSGLDLNPNLV